MTPSERAWRRTVSPDDVIALCEETAALVRAGLPLEQGLTALADELPGSMRSLAGRLAQHVNGGATLADAFAIERESLPSGLAAMIEAGLRSGHLAAALEGVATTTRRVDELRRDLALALAYPMFTFVLAVGLFAGFTLAVAPRISQALASLDVSDNTILATCVLWGESAAVWGPVAVLAILLVGGVWWRTATSDSFAPSSGRVAWFGRLPGAASVLRCYQTATFGHVLALLIENQTPLPEALVLAAESTGSATLSAAAEQASAKLRAGEPVSGSKISTALTPLLCWLIDSKADTKAFVVALANVRDMYQARAERRSEAIRSLLPAALLIGIAATATLAYALVLFLPMSSMLERLGEL